MDDCIAATGRRPIEWLLDNVALDARWHLVHATHATPAEIHGVAQRNAGVVLCPTTEANLGDGLPDLERWLASGVRLSIGSDSQVTRDWREELRLLEYGQRLAHRRRNIAADEHHVDRDATVRARAPGERAGSRLGRWGFVAGRGPISWSRIRRTTRFGACRAAHLLDAMVFVSPGETLPRRDGRGRVGHPRRSPLGAGARRGSPRQHFRRLMSSARGGKCVYNAGRVMTAGCKHIPRTPTETWGRSALRLAMYRRTGYGESGGRD